MNKDVVPENFSLSLALFDALPVLFFCGSMIIISVLFRSSLFLAGSLICFWAGAAKVIWKIIVATNNKNVWWLFVQMRIAMPIGFLLMLLAVFLRIDEIDFPIIFSALASFPTVVFFVIGIFGMVFMGFFASKLNSADLRSNWIEQIINSIAQGSFFIGLLMLI